MTPRSGDVVLIDFGANPFGHEQAGIRPAIFVSVMKVIAIVIPLTSNLKAARYRATTTVNPDKMNCLAKPSVALAFHMRSVDTRRVLKRIGTLSAKDRSAVNKIIRSVALIA